MMTGIGCGGRDKPSLFERLTPDRTGITFVNELSPSEDLNIANWPYFYNGSGVAVGDVDGDGLVDLYFTANQGSNRLYLNQGDFQFKEVTSKAGVDGRADWSNGVAMADVTGNGRLDLYVSVVDGYLGLEGHNELFVNQGPDENGVPQFEEQAAEYGLDHRGYGIQALFFDYDGDGDLDVYLLKGSGTRPRKLPPSELRNKPHRRIGDRLYRNDDSTFVDVTDEAGLYSGPTGAGLGVVASDLDGNGCLDLYVANDFFEHDYLYYNNCDGTFTEAIESATGHVSYSSMGVDAADYNNDGRPDVAVADMLPFQEDILKTTEPSDDRRTYRARRRYGYHHQLDRNTLQLNQGNRRFSEIGLLAGVAATDWSWAPLFADLDNDGRKDLFVTNGIYRRPDDLDYFEYALEEGRLDELKAGDTELYKELRARMPQDPVPNFAFRNDGDLTFSDSTAAWGLDRPGFSNGATYADLDNDGSLDLVVNNINAPASIYENRADTLRDHQYLKVVLEGAGANTHGFGAKVTVYQEGRTQHLEQMLTRGYQSSVDPRLHVGLGTESVDSVQVTWPDGRTETRGAVAPNQTITLRQAEATAPGSGEDPESEPAAEGPRFTVTSAERIGIDFRHEENRPHPDLQREPLMPRTLSSEGPALAVGDATGNGLDDVYLGGGAGQPGALYVQQAGGRFRRLEETDSLWATHAQREDVDASFFDATGNGALDLYVVSGGNEAEAGSEVLRDRLYLNEEDGQFRWAKGALPATVATNGGAVAPGDADGDGDTDLFVGSRSVPGRYGAVPESALLENDGSGQFTDGTEEVAPGLRDVGMVADATWADLGAREGRGDREGPALVVVGEWMPITVFEQDGGRLIDRTAERGLDSTQGWWNAVRAADITGDGTDELVAGNFALNSRLRAAPETPVRLYLSDADGDGRSEPLLTRYNEGESYLWARRDELIARMPGLEEQFPTYEAFGAARIEDVLSEEQLQGSTRREARVFASALVEIGPDTTTLEPLPTRAQFAPVYGLLTCHESSGGLELVMGGNFYGVSPEQGHYDASLGTLLRKKKKGGWATVPPSESGLYLKGEVRALRRLRRGDDPPLILVARNEARPQVVRLADGPTCESGSSE
jgi:hypothetical protein